ncbi:YghX family hydrolase [Paracoccus nototheniae]|uniref:YghX family hydrolase n=1 Tax=Paracoccus nototheniae TaxID=2489002 RepID=UPI00103AC13C|nr:YghX family hydrolase [Paracoccus nototheniae]
MGRMKAGDFPQELLELYDFYAHGRIAKRQFLDRAVKFAVGGMTALALLTMLRPNYALAQQVNFNDPAIVPEYITYPSPEGHGAVRAYQVAPAGEGPWPAVLVIHENRGLNPYIEDVARRLAKAGYLALAPDGLTSKGGYPGNDEEGRALQAEVDPEKLMSDFFAAAEFLMAHEAGTGKVGAVGFCYGGGVCHALAVAYPELGASVPFYGRQAPVGDVPRIEVPMLLHFADMDERVNEGWPAFEAALTEAGKTYEGYVYPGTNHGFHNDSTPRYDEEAAALAWQRTLDWFGRYLA